MKKFIILVISIVLITGLFTTSFASDAITERSDIKTSINGTISSYATTPIIVDGRTLLPLRDLLTNLGVVNDDQHIIWNSQERSVTVIKDSTKIYLVVGNAQGKINNNPVAIDVAPVNYNSRVYIPARFVAEAFGMSVAWDPDTKIISIQDKFVIKSANGKFSAAVPGNWIETSDLNDSADLQVMSQTDDAYMIALMESKLDFTSYESWKSALLEQLTVAYQNVKLSDPSNVTVNGNPAVQYVMTATYEDVNVKMLLTYIKGSDYYGQIMCWSLVSEYSNFEKEFVQISSSIQGL